MPFFQHNGANYYFAHVPKCAGTSIENYLSKRFGALAFLDRGFMVNRRRTWSRTSPQHITAAVLERLFPPDFFTAGFAVVRHPVSRFRSAYYFNKKRLPEGESMEETILRISRLSLTEHFRLDNHFLPQTRIVPEWCDCFKFEDGLDPIVAWVNAATNTSSSETIKQSLKGRYRRDEPMSKTLIGRIKEFYAEDFEHFGFDRLP